MLLCLLPKFTLLTSKSMSLNLVSTLVCLRSVAQSCPTLCDPMDCSPPGPSVPGDSPGKNPGVGCHALFQGIFPTQGSNPDLPHCRQILYRLSHQGSPSTLESQSNLYLSTWDPGISNLLKTPRCFHRAKKFLKS